MSLQDGSSEVVDFFRDSTVFVTGATGFLGQLFVEKLLRTCNVRRIYVLARPKKGKTVRQRLDDIFKGAQFEPLSKLCPDFADKITPMEGDCALPDLGLNPDDKMTLITTVQFIIHCAATVRFDEKLRMAGNINVRAAMDLVKIASQMQQLKVLLHVSTAYSNCTRQQVDEHFYPPPLKAQSLLSFLDNTEDDDTLDKITPGLLGDYPNTYTFTKAIAEDIFAKAGESLPVTIIRPSIVIASVKEPMPGWLDNFYGPTGVVVAVGVGILRCFLVEKDMVTDLVPVDYVINCGLAAMWQRGGVEETTIYNYVSGVEKPLTWSEFMRLSYKHGNPSILMIWHSFCLMTNSKFLFTVAAFFLHTIPGHLVDLVLQVLGKKPMLVKGYAKIDKFSSVLNYFGLRQWNFSNDHTQALYSKLKSGDKELFQFSMKNVDMDSYFRDYTKGIRVHVMKESMDQLAAAKRKYWAFFVAHYALLGMMAWMVYEASQFVVSLIFNLR